MHRNFAVSKPKETENKNRNRKCDQANRRQIKGREKETGQTRRREPSLPGDRAPHAQLGSQTFRLELNLPGSLARGRQIVGLLQMVGLLGLHTLPSAYVRTLT